MAGSGKSTVAKKLAQKYHLRYYSGGDALKALALEQGYLPKDRGWWESSEGLRFLQVRCKDQKFDKEIDRKLLEFAQSGNVILDSWTMPWLLKKGFKIWLEASVEKRAARLARRDSMNHNEAVAALGKKEEQTKAVYKKLYGFSLSEDFEPFQLILDVNELSSYEVFETICYVVDNVLLGKS
jgi:cytidylate kinase